MRQHMLLKHNGEFGKANPQQPSVTAIFTATRRSFNPGRGAKPHGVLGVKRGSIQTTERSGKAAPGYPRHLRASGASVLRRGTDS